MLTEPLAGGTVRGITIVSFIQLIELEQKTCMVELYTPSKEIGLLLFEDGILFDAVCGAIHGEEAAIRIIAAEKAVIRFRKLRYRRIERRIKVESISLILEAIRRKDELNAISRNTLNVSELASRNQESVDNLCLFESEANDLDKLLSKIKKDR